MREELTGNPATSPRRGVALQSLEGLPSHVVTGAIASRACDCNKEGLPSQALARSPMNLAIGPRSAAVPRPPYALAVLMMLQSSWAQPPYTLAVLTALQSS